MLLAVVRKKRLIWRRRKLCLAYIDSKMTISEYCSTNIFKSKSEKGKREKEKLKKRS